MHYFSGRYLLLLLAAMLAAGCQRISYSFQPAGSRSAPVVAPMAADTLPPAPIAAASQQPLDVATKVVRHQQRRQPIRRALTTAAGRWLRGSRALPVAAHPRAHRAGPVGAAPTGAESPHLRSRGLALLLAGIPLLFGFPLGLHDFYLGYPGKGIFRLLLLATAFVLLSLGAVGFFVSALFGTASGASALFTLGAVLYVGLLVWQLVDLVLILTNNLLPRKGEYYPRPFQLRSEPAAELPAR